MKKLNYKKINAIQQVYLPFVMEYAFDDKTSIVYVRINNKLAFSMKIVDGYNYDDIIEFIDHSENLKMHNKFKRSEYENVMKYISNIRTDRDIKRCHELRHNNFHFETYADRAGLRFRINGTTEIFIDGMDDGVKKVWIGKESESFSAKRLSISRRYEDCRSFYYMKHPDWRKLELENVKKVEVFLSDCMGGCGDKIAYSRAYDKETEIDVYAVENGFEFVELENENFLDN